MRMCRSCGNDIFEDEPCPICSEGRAVKSRGGELAFCAGCGVRQCMDVGCESCQEPTRFPVHLMSQSWREHAIHCEACGDELTA